MQRESNPYRPDLPSHLARQDPDLFLFLRELTESLREQHNITQAGDTTFPYEFMSGFQKTPLYTPGSLSRFQHPIYGILLARYVKFVESTPGEVGAPYGFNVKKVPFSWAVSAQSTDSNLQLIVGVGAANTVPAVGDYGWVIVSGVNLNPIKIRGEPPVVGSILRWVATNETQISGDTGSVGKVFSTEGLTQIDDDLWELPEGCVIIESGAQTTTATTIISGDGSMSQEQLTELAETMLKLVVCGGFCAGTGSGTSGGGNGGDSDVANNDIAFRFTTPPDPSEVLDYFVVVTPFSFPANFNGAVGFVDSLPDSNFTMSLKIGGTLAPDSGIEVGTITVYPSGLFAFSTAAESAVAIPVGLIKLVAPPILDVGISGVAFTLKG